MCSTVSVHHCVYLLWNLEFWACLLWVTILVLFPKLLGNSCQTSIGTYKINSLHFAYNLCSMFVQNCMVNCLVKLRAQPKMRVWMWYHGAINIQLAKGTPLGALNVTDLERGSEAVIDKSWLEVTKVMPIDITN